MMDRENVFSAVICKLCGEAFTLPEADGADSNLPRVLLCSHIFCTSCLLSIQCDDIITCPECEVESTVPEGGVYGLQEDSRIIGLIYTAKMNKNKSLRFEKLKKIIRKKLPTSRDMNANTEYTEQLVDMAKFEMSVDEALAQAAENLAQLEYIQETLTTGLAEQVKRERVRLEVEIKQASDKALLAVYKWKDLQLNQLTKLEAQFSTSQEQLCCVQERIKALDIAMQKAREVRRLPLLEQYCNLDNVLQTLQAPVDNKSFDMKCITLGSGMSCVFQAEGLNQSLSVLLKMEVGNPKPISGFPPSGHLGNSSRKSRWHHAEGRKSKSSPPSHKLLSPQKQDQESSEPERVSRPSAAQSTKPHHKLTSRRHSSPSEPETPDVIVEELIDDKPEQALPPTGPELANDKWRMNRKRRNWCETRRNVTHWVVVTHIVNPSHFYIRYVAEKREIEALSKKINSLCARDSCHFASSDTLETGTMIFVKCKEGLWSRARVVEVKQNGCAEALKACPVEQLASVTVFFLDHGLTISISMQSEDDTTQSPLKAVNSHLRKVVNMDLHHLAPQAIRCSLKDLVPYDLTQGWSKEAQVEFHKVVGSAAVEMKPICLDRDSLQVDLRKAPMDQSSCLQVSVREYLVFIEVARFYSPLISGRRQLLYSPPFHPKINMEVNAVVSHINNPADFYIQLVENTQSLLLSGKLQDCYNETEVAAADDLRVYCPVIGEAYVARYDDKLWYRAQVVGHKGMNVAVRYVDFGNEKTVLVSDLRKIKDEFFALPIMAIRCCLSDVIPLEDGRTWSDACIDRFIGLAYQKLVTVVFLGTGSVCKNEPLQVKLLQSNVDGTLTNIAELLVADRQACFKQQLDSKESIPPDDESVIWDPPLDLGLAKDDTDEPNQKSSKQEEEPQEGPLQLNFPSQLKDLKVLVSHINSPSSFYVQLIQNSTQLNRVCKLLKKEFALSEPQDVVWKAEMYCAAHVNGVWERGQICADVTSSSMAEVMRCDYGNKVMLHVSNLRPLPSSLIGSYALECTLTDIRPAGGQPAWTATACDLISYSLTGALAVMTIKEVTDERPVPVTLFCSNKMEQFVSFADFLISKGLALRERKPREAVAEQPKETDARLPESEAQTNGDQKVTHPTPASVPLPFPPPPVSACTLPKPAPRTIMSAEKVKTQLYHPPELPCPGHLQITVSALGEDGCIYMRTQNAENQLKLLRERIQQRMKTLPRLKPYTWKSVQGCAIMGPDMLWYRGQLLEVLGEHVKVQYVDSGLVENIPVVHVYPKLLCEDIPQLCIPGQLHGINPVGGKWQWDAVALLREMFLNRSVEIQVLELPSDPRKPLTVELFLDGLSLSRILCHHEHATMDQPVSEQKAHSIISPACLDVWDIDTEGLRDPEESVQGAFIYPNLPQEGEQFPVRVKHLLTPNELFLWPLEGTADVKVDGETLDEALSRINANIGSLPQLTNFPPGSPCLAEYSDGKYYRAQLVKIFSVEPVMVLVHHVDFGSDDTLPTCKLRRMPAELLRFPLRALKARVAGFKAPSVSTQEVMLPYSPQWSVKALRKMMELLHTNIRASVVACEPELTVLLYSENGELVHLPLVSSGLAELE